MSQPHLFTIINESSDLEQWCAKARAFEWIGLDTEFIAERYYQPLLCLIQTATPEGNFIIDPLTNRMDVTPFWNLIADGTHETIVHAGRLELEFCWRYTGRFPKKVFDTQIAAGIISGDYPAGYSKIVAHFLNIHTPGTESRSNWKFRPLSERQLAYAVDDIAYLHDVRDILAQMILKKNRWNWFQDEIASWMCGIEHLVSPERWRRILNGSKWEPHELAIVRALWKWRDRIAQQRNCSARHVLRDDLILELAKRKISDVRGIRSIRGMEREDLHYQLPELSICISMAASIPESSCPQITSQYSCTKLMVLGGFLHAILGSICHEKELALSLVATPTDVREWIAWRLKISGAPTQTPLLARGWRAEIVGKSFDALLSGEKVIRISDPLKDFPIEIV